MKKIKSILSNCILLLFAITISLVFAELILRTFLNEIFDSPLNIYQADSYLGWKLKSNMNLTVSRNALLMRINSNDVGFREMYQKLNKGQKQIRIIGVGDSFLFGYGVNIENSVLYILNSLIKKGFRNDVIYDVSNFGVPGYNINQYYKIAKNCLNMQQVDILLLFFYTNDFKSDTEYDFKGVNEEGYLIRKTQEDSGLLKHILFDINSFIKRKSKLYMFGKIRLKPLFQKIGIKAKPKYDIYKSDTNLFNKYKHTFTLIEKIQKLCEKEKVKFILCIIPHKIQVVGLMEELKKWDKKADIKDFDLLKPQKELGKYCISKDIMFIDFYQHFLNSGETTQLYFKEDSHWTQRGHEIAASAIFNYIERNKIINVDYKNTSLELEKG